MSRVALDTNILAYFAGVKRSKHDRAKIEKIRQLIDNLSPAATPIVPLQALGELFVVMLKAGAPATGARELLAKFAEELDVAVSMPQTAHAAADLVVDHKLQFWDALIITAAAEAGCTLLLSEDMQDGFVARGLTILNPLAEPSDPKLAALTGQ